MHPPSSGEKLVPLLDSEFFGLIAMMADSAVWHMVSAAST